MDNDRACEGRLSNQTANPLAAIVVLALAAIIGLGLATEERVEVHFMVQYAVDVPGAYGLQISLMFEPRFPDGSIGCSACG